MELARLHPFLVTAWKAAKLYDRYLNAAATDFGLTRSEKDVLLFLYNNYPLDTAGDIVKYRSISKSLAAKSVASLTAAGFLEQVQDASDARFVHLSVTGAAMDAVRELKEAQKEFFSVFEDCLPVDEQREFIKSISRIKERIEQELQGMTQ